MEERGKGQEVPWPGGPAGPLESQGAGIFGERAGAKASRPPFRRSGVFFESRVIPADASGAYRPNPQATAKLVPGHPLKGYF